MGEGLTLTFVDTIGFVLDLDPHLIQSFCLNLEDIRNADIVLLFIEVTDTPVTLKMKLLEGLRLLREMGVSKDRIIVVFNKIDVDRIRARELIKELDGWINMFSLEWTAISAKERINLNDLLKIVQEKLEALTKHPL